MAFFAIKKNKLWIWKAYCRNTKQLIDWELGDRSTDTLRILLERLEEFNVKIYFTDKWVSYAELIPPDRLKQTKALTFNIERNNMQQRHWFARFRRRTCVVSRAKYMVEATMSLFCSFHNDKNKIALFDLFNLS